MLVLVAILLLALVVFAIYLVVKNIKLKKTDEVLENYNTISQERIDNIKNKYKAIENIKKIKRATKEDVEAFYKSQMEDK